MLEHSDFKSISIAQNKRCFYFRMLKSLTMLRQASTTLGSRVVVRGKRTVKQVPGASRVVNMLSVFSARQKQPRRLKLCKEDLVRHQVVTAAWRIHQKNEQEQRRQKLETQYEKIKEACTELELLDKDFITAANTKPTSARFPLELRVPTNTPPKVVWENEWVPPNTK